MTSIWMGKKKGAGVFLKYVWGGVQEIGCTSGSSRKKREIPIKKRLRRERRVKEGGSRGRNSSPQKRGICNQLVGVGGGTN